jgi:hypothetical protein
LQTSLGVGDTGGEGAVDGKFAQILGDLTVEVAEPVRSGEKELGLIFEFKTTSAGRWSHKKCHEGGKRGGKALEAAISTLEEVERGAGGALNAFKGFLGLFVR